MARHLFEHVPFTRERIHFLDSSTPDAGAECARYEQAIAAAGGIDLQVLGIGANGHVGFNEPGDWLRVRTHLEALRPETRRANAHLFGGVVARVPREAATMGIGTIHRARRIVLLATGEAKASAIARTLAGPVTPRLPASFLQLHSAAEVWLDRAAAAGLAPATAEHRPAQAFWPEA
jgi:glucosamine-6-phosphate deaminase